MFRTDRIEDNLVTLKKIGVTREKANNLARLDWVTREYIEAHYRQAVEIEHQSVWCMEHGKGIGRIMLVVALAVISLACVTSAMLVPVPTAQGTLYAAHLEKAGTPAAEPTAEGKGICAIAWTAVHLRAARGSDARVLDTVARGAVVTVCSKAGDWWLVELDGRVGYVRGKYLQEMECK